MERQMPTGSNGTFLSPALPLGISSSFSLSFPLLCLPLLSEPLCLPIPLSQSFSNSFAPLHIYLTYILCNEHTCGQLLCRLSSV